MRRALIVLVLLAGCSVLSKSELPPTRYFRPAAPAAAPRDGAATRDARPLRFRPVTAAEHLRERIVYASSEVELGFYELARWTEPPAAYVQEALGDALFERGGFRRASSGDAGTLEVHVIGFEEVLEPHQARVALRVAIVGSDGQAIVERTIASTAAIPPRADEDDDGAQPDHAATARAMGAALDLAVAETVALVEASLPR